MQDANVRMVQAGDGLGLALKALLQSCIVGKMRGKNLDSDSAVQARVARALNFLHAARAQRREDFVGAQASTGGQGH